MDSKAVISNPISFQPNAWSGIEQEISIGEVIMDIKRGKYRVEVNQLRFYLKNDEKEKYDSHKKRLPGVTFCANFEGIRKKEYLKSYHNLIVLDIDKLSDIELSRVRRILDEDQYVFTSWLSPSEKGFKGLVYLDYQFAIDCYGVDKSHKIAFEQITRYFSMKHSIHLDTSGSDTTRLCFLSYDKDLRFKSTIHPFIVENISESEHTHLIGKDKNFKTGLQKRIKHHTTSRDVLYNPSGKNNQHNKKMIIKIIKYLKKNKISITSTYDDWYRVALAIANSFTHDVGEKYFLSLCELDGTKHDEVQSKNILIYCYNNSQGDIKFKTIVFLAKNKGFKN